MFNYYLFNDSYDNVQLHELEMNLQTLNDLAIEEKKEDDLFLKHDSIWDVNTAEGNFAEVVFSRLEDKQLSMIVLPKLFNSIQSTQTPITTLAQFDDLYKIYNAFYGINFDSHNFPADKCIINKDRYVFFRESNLWDLTPDSLWERKDLLFKKIILCPSVQTNLADIGGTYLEQIVSKLQELDRYAVDYWQNGNFSYNDANDKTFLNISPESKKTMEQEKYYNQRVFSMPDGRRLCFELHIKTGNLRFHFLAENGILYVGYIGKHLDTAKYN
jgi:hypothetical protein